MWFFITKSLSTETRQKTIVTNYKVVSIFFNNLDALFQLIPKQWSGSGLSNSREAVVYSSNKSTEDKDLTLNPKHVSAWSEK